MNTRDQIISFLLQQDDQSKNTIVELQKQVAELQKQLAALSSSEPKA